MRRVDEAVREVLSDAITINSQGSTRRIRHRDRRRDRPRPATRPRLRVRARRRAACASARCRGCSRRTACSSARSRASCGSSTRRRSSSSTTTRPSAGMRIAELIDREAERSEHAQRRSTSLARELVLDELRDGERFVLTTHEHPDGDALGSLAAMQQVLCALGKDAVLLHGGRRVPAALRVPLPRAAAARHRGARRRRGPHRGLPGLRQHRPQPGRGAQAGRADPQHRPPPRQHALRHRRPRGAGRVLHRRGDLGPDARRSGSS